MCACRQQQRRPTSVEQHAQKVSCLLQPPAMAAPQLMRCVLSKLAAPRSFEKGIFMSRDADSGLPPPPAASAFQQRFEVVFVDASGWLNIMGGVTSSAMQHVSR
jgi:hypothetical protein